jgi:hypothetical protein
MIKQMNNLKATWNILTCASKISQLIEIFIWNLIGSMLHGKRGAKEKKNKRTWRKKKKKRYVNSVTLHVELHYLRN